MIVYLFIDYFDYNKTNSYLNILHSKTRWEKWIIESKNKFSNFVVTYSFIW